MQSKQVKRKKAVEMLKGSLATREKELLGARELKSDDGQPLPLVNEIEGIVKNLKRMIVEGEGAIDRNGRY